MKNLTFDLYAALASLVKYGNLYHLTEHLGSIKVEPWRSLLPEPDGRHHPSWDSETVGELVVRGLAERARHDPLQALGKVVPTSKAAETLEGIVLTRETPGVGVHLSHCCLRKHGCKYAHEFCPVETKLLPPDHERCGACYEEEEWDNGLKEYASEDLADELRRRGYDVTAAL